MKAGILIFALTSFLTFWEFGSFPCGPEGKCQCDSKQSINCTNTAIPLRVICEYIDKFKEHSIDILHAERNDYTHIEELDFGGCDRLKALYLERNMISSVDKGSFSNLFRLELLDISHNNLAVYNKSVRQNDTFPFTLKTLMLNGNLKMKVNNRSTYPNLSYLGNLSTLFMDGLNDEMFPDYYGKIATLETVILSGLNGYCNITTITNSTFENLPYLKVLNISSCNVQTIFAGAFKSLSKLEVLDLSQNLHLGFRMLRNISYGLQFTSIKSFNYSKVYNTFGMGTKIMNRDICYLWNTTLTELVLNSNRIQLIDTNAGILMTATLKVLRIEDNKFTFGPYLLQMGCLANLEQVYASFQNTPHDPLLYGQEPVGKQSKNVQSHSDCPFMEEEFLFNISKQNRYCHFFKSDDVNVSQNLPMFPRKLKGFEFSNSDMQYRLKKILVVPTNNLIENLDFSRNILDSWIGPIGPLPNLKQLNLSRNYCSHVGPMFFSSCCGTVEILQLQENFLGLVLANDKYGSAVFDGLTNVKLLNLSSNIVSFLSPSVFSKMSKLESIDLSVNNIEKWTADVTSLDNLLHLNLKFNFLHKLPSELRDKLESNAKRHETYFTINLSNNTITTYCDEREYLQWMVKHRNNMVNFDDYIFHDTSGNRLSAEQFVTVVHEMDKTCRSYTLLIVFCSVGISVFLAIVLAGFIYKNRWKLRYLMRTSKMRHFGYKKLHVDLKDNVDFIHDAFISYANENARFILDKIIPNLESRGLNLCLHDRNFLPGNDIADNILGAIRSSKKTVVILSKDFLKSKWCVYEFNMARMESIYSRGGDSCLVVVMLEDVPAKYMSTEMLEWIKTNTYIEYTTEEPGEELFWQTLYETLTEQ